MPAAETLVQGGTHHKSSILTVRKSQKYHVTIAEWSRCRLIVCSSPVSQSWIFCKDVSRKSLHCQASAELRSCRTDTRTAPLHHSTHGTTEGMSKFVISFQCQQMHYLHATESTRRRSTFSGYSRSVQSRTMAVVVGETGLWPRRHHLLLMKTSALTATDCVSLYFCDTIGTVQGLFGLHLQDVMLVMIQYYTRI